MPVYSYKRESTGEIIDVVQGMNDKHEYFGPEGNQDDWKRVFTVPNASIDTQVDPFSQDQFRERTRNKKGTYGDLMDHSKEMSDRRKEIAGGTDPIKEKAYENYSKERRGAKHPDQIKEKGIDNKHVKVEF